MRDATTQMPEGPFAIPNDDANAGRYPDKVPLPHAPVEGVDTGGGEEDEWPPSRFERSSACRSAAIAAPALAQPGLPFDASHDLYTVDILV